MKNTGTGCSRRQWLAWSGLLLGHLAGPHALAGPPSEARKSPLVFAAITPRGTEATVAGWTPFVQRLAQELGQPITLKPWTAPDPGALAEAFASGEIDLAWVGNAAALAVVERGVGEVFAQMVTESGSTGYNALIVTHRDSGLHTLEDAQRPEKKLTFADGETKSFSGHLVPLYYAFAKRGISNPASLYAKVLTGTHSENLILAATRKADIATANNEELALLRARQPELADQLRILWTSPFLPQSPLIWSTALPLELRRRIQQAVVSLGKTHAVDKEMLKNVNNLSGFRKSKNSQLIVAGDIEMFAALQQVNNNAALPEAEKTRRREAISERASRLELRLKLPPSVQ